MNVGPVIHRELRCQARQRTTYWLRVLSGGVVLAAAGWALSSPFLLPTPGFGAGGRPADGRSLFWGLNKVMAILIWLLAPALTADCLAREKREGTLGLLFLTPLRGVDVVIGKAASHTLRALMFLVAAYPVLMLPVLLGGISWIDALRLFLLQLSVLGLALAAGVTASALSRDWLRARLLACLLTVAASAIFVLIYVASWSLWRATPATQRLILSRGGQVIGTATAPSLALAYWHSLEGWVSSLSYQLRNPIWLWRSGNTPSTMTSLWLTFGVLALCWGLAWLAIEFAARGLLKTWRLDAAPATPHPSVAKLTRDRFAVLWRRKRRQRLLENSPIAWLHNARWTARIAKWAWCGWVGIDLCYELAAFSYPADGTSNERWNFFKWPVLLSVAFSAAASFRQERETGTLEMLLVTPLSPSAILAGRLRGLAGVFAPALFLMMVSAGLATLNHTPPSSEPSLTHWGDFGLSAVELGLGSTGIAVLGLSYGLRRNGVVIATLRAIASWYLVPYAVSGAALLALASISHSQALQDLALLAEWAITQPGQRLAALVLVRETLLNSMGSFWLLLTGTRILLVAHAWRLGKRALAQRDFLPRPKAVRVDPI